MINLLSSTREKFLEFFKSKNHLIIESAPLIPENDSTLLFINSGMAPLKRFFLGQQEPASKKMANSQFCLRVGGKHNDLSEIGYTKRHHTFFEMLGNFSFGDYGKKEAIAYAWEFLTQILKLDKSRLFVTVHPDDLEAKTFWLEHIQEKRITLLKENSWSMGNIGPYGYCSEIFYDLTGNLKEFQESETCLEIWNLVFMQYYTDGVTNSELPKLCIDTGMGLERIVSVLENKLDTYEIGFFKKSLQILGKTENTINTKIFLDHFRCAVFLIHNNILPSANEHGYILRNIIRRMLKAFECFELDLSKLALLLEFWSQEYAINFEIEKTLEVIEKEKSQFEQILLSGIKKFEQMAQKKHFTGQDLFLLHDTYGFSIDLTVDLLKQRKIEYDLAEFEKLMQESKQKSKTESINKTFAYESTEFVDQPILMAKIIGIENEYIILDKTNFYAESGGQVGDTGIIKGADFELTILDTKKSAAKKSGDIFLHKYEGVPKLGPVECKIDFDRRKRITAHHSATHILHHILTQTLSPQIKPMGSYVCEQKLRLDFSYNEQINEEKLNEIEIEVNKFVLENHVRKVEYMKQEEALKTGAKAYFTYDEIVRVISIGPSIELCGGTHVNASGDIGLFKIIKISTISAGVKRIEATVGLSAIEHINEKLNLLHQISQILNVQENGILKKIAKNTQEVQFEKHIFEKNFNKIGLFVSKEKLALEELMKSDLLDLVCNIIVGQETLSIILKTIKYDAKKIIIELGKLIEAKGSGGRKDYAQTGGKLVDYKIILERLKELT